MSELRSLLDSEARRVLASNAALEEVITRSRRRARRTRALTIAVALIIAAGSLAGVLAAFSGDSSRQPGASNRTDAWSRSTILQVRPVEEVVPLTDPAWKTLQLTCAGSAEAFSTCFRAASQRDHIVLSNSGGPRVNYVLGPVVVDGGDVVKAQVTFAPAGNQMGRYVSIELDPDGAKAFQRATMKAVAASSPLNEIAFVVDGRVAAAPTVQGVISNGTIQIPGLSEASASELANALSGSS
jgi:preprotein translocase subunit SecD